MIKFFFRLILLALVVLGLAVVFAPNLASTIWGKTVFLKIFKAITGHELSIDKLKLSWWEGQDLEGISLETSSGKPLFKGKKIVTDATLWQVAFYHDLGNMTVSSPKIVIQAELPKKLAWLHSGFIPTLAVTPTMPVFFGHLTVENGKAQFLSSGLDPIELREVALDASFFKSEVKLKGSGLTSQGKTGGHFEIAGTYSSLANVDLAATVENFPVRALDQVAALARPSLQGKILSAIGTAMTVELKVKNLPDTLELYCNATSPIFQAHIQTQTQGGRVTLAVPATVNFQISPLKGELKVDQLSLALNDKESFAFQASLKGDTVHFNWGDIHPFTLFVATENFKTRNFSVKIDSSQVKINSTLYLPDNWDQLHWQGQGLLPANTRVDFSAQTLGAVTATFQGDEWQGTLNGGYDTVDNAVFLNKPALVHGHLPPFHPLLKEQVPLHLTIEPFKIGLDHLSGPVSAKLVLDRFQLAQITVGETTASISGDIGTQKGSFDLTSTVGSGSLDAVGSVAGPKEVAAKVNLKQLPTELLDLFLASPLSPLLGTDLTGTVDVSTLDKKLSFQLTSPVMTAQAALEEKGNLIQLTKPAQVTLNLTPAGYTALDKWLNTTPTPFILAQPSVIKSTISSLQWPVGSKDGFYKADLSIDTLAFAGKEISKTTSLSGIQFHIEHPSANLYDFGLSAATLSLQGKVDLATGLSNLKCKLDQFPTEALDVVARAIGKTSLSMGTLFGPHVNLTANTSLQAWSGPVDIQLSSENIRTSLSGALTQGVLTLNEPLYIQMGLTHDLSSMILTTLNPLSLTTFASHDPITLEIPSHGFSYPIVPANPAQINIPKGRLELGKIYCQNEGNINVALGLLKLSQYSADQNLELWFAPLDFQVTKGIMSCERTEILVANAYQICSWGNVDFPSDQVDMVLGLTATCLKKAFGIKDLPENYVLQIPMRGHLNDVKINTSKATTKIGLLLLWQQKSVAGSLGNGPAGAIAGKFLNKLGPLPDSDAKAPPPKPPFPWEQPPSTKKKKTSDNRKFIDPAEQPLKQALKFLR